MERPCIGPVGIVPGMEIGGSAGEDAERRTVEGGYRTGYSVVALLLCQQSYSFIGPNRSAGEMAMVAVATTPAVVEGSIINMRLEDGPPIQSHRASIDIVDEGDRLPEEIGLPNHTPR